MHAGQQPPAVLTSIVTRILITDCILCVPQQSQI